jgi:hypothetical protein
MVLATLKLLVRCVLLAMLFLKPLFTFLFSFGSTPILV